MHGRKILQSQRSFITDFYGESCCPEEEYISMGEIESAIDDCKAMLDDAINRHDKNEISYWRKLLQENKVRRRELLNT